MLEVLAQLRLALGHVVGRGEDDGVGAHARRVARQGHRLDERGVRDPDEDGHASPHLPGHAADQLAPEPMAQARALARRAEDEEAVHASGEDVLDQPLEAVAVERVAVEERGDEGRHDAARGARQRHSFRSTFGGRNQTS